MVKIYKILCDNCGKVITAVTTDPDGENKEDPRPSLKLSGAGWICSSTVYSFSKSSLLRIAKLIEEKKFRECAQMGYSTFGFFCYDCGKNYCAGCWINITPVFDESLFYDYTWANCPVGHRQEIND